VGRRADGEDFPAAVSGSVVTYRGRPHGLAVLRDLSRDQKAERERRRLRSILRTISRCHLAVTKASDEREMMQGVCRAIVDHGGLAAAWAGRVEHDPARTITPLGRAGRAAAQLTRLPFSWADDQRGQSPCGRAVREGSAVVLPDLASHAGPLPWREICLAQGISAAAAFPLVGGGEALGVLVVYAAEAGAFPPQVVELLDDLAREVGHGLAGLKTADEHSRTLAELQASRETLAAIMAAAPVGFGLWQKRRLVWGNQELFAMTGYSPADLVGRGARILYPSQEEYERVGRAMYRPGGRGRAEASLVRADGGRLEVQLESASLDPSDPSRGSIVAMRDVSAERAARARRRELEDQLRQSHKMEALGALAGGVAHDFNNILGAILGYSELAQDELDPGHPAQSHLDQALRAGERARDLVRQILAFSRQTEREESPLKLAPLVLEALKLIRASLPSSIEIRTELAPEQGAVLADPTQLHQVLMNLCTNAAQAMEQGGTLTVGVDQVSLDPEAARSLEVQPGVYRRLTVADTGPGVPPEARPRVFEPYFTTKQSSANTGLGLAVCHGIVKSHDGAITIRSAPHGRGASFQVLLPRVTGRAAEARPEAEPAPGGSERILLVDDEEALVEVCRRMLGRLGYQVEAFTASPRALEAFRADPYRFDLVLTDLTMPRLGGLELCAQVQALRPGAPVVLVTGFSTGLSEKELKAAGVRALLKKPLVRRELGLALRQALDQAAAG
jgi:PAS domain S-box-containing protein